MPGRATPLVILGLTALTVVSALQADVLQFTPDRDTTLFEDLEGDVSNGAGNFLFLGRTGPDGNSEVRRGLIRFDISAIPANAVIDNVELSVEIVAFPSIQSISGTAGLHRLLADWGEGGSNAPGPEGQGTVAQTLDATWQHRFYDTELWNSSGGDFSEMESASANYSDALETLTFNSTASLVRDVTKWVRYPDQNFGWILIGSESQDFTARKIDSRNNMGGTPALLTVEYHLEGPTDNLALELVASGLTRPVVIANAGDGSNRLFIAQQQGIIRIYDADTDTLLPMPFLDITTLVDDAQNEQGLLGLAFHPDFENNRQFYVNYTFGPAGSDNDGTRVAMYQASIGNPNVADTTETSILEFDQYSWNHNGGDMHFDHDGYLVISSGDGGGSFDPENNGQSLTTLLGKMLRIDVDDTRAPDGSTGLCGQVQNYGIPSGNPYAGSDEGCDEILHYGMRNPWRFSIDALTGDLFIGDVGQGLWEEIDFSPAGATDINYGWDTCEGAHVTNSQNVACTFGELPIIEFSSSGTGNCSVTGGYVYRGGIVSLQGRYIYADYCSARIWVATFDGAEWVSEEWTETPSLGAIPTFGQDEQCELYVADFASDSVYRIVNTEDISSSGFEGSEASGPLNCR